MDEGRVQLDEAGYRSRQLFRPWHCGSADKHRDYDGFAFERLANLHPQDVLRVLQTFEPGLLPVRPDHDKRGIRSFDGFLNGLREVSPKLDVINVLPHQLVTEPQLDVI